MCTYTQGIEKLSDEEVEEYVMNGLCKEKKINKNKVSNDNADGWESKLDTVLKLCMMQMVNNMTSSIANHPNQNSNNAVVTAPVVPVASAAVTVPPAVPALPGLAAEPIAVAPVAYGPTHGTTTNTSTSRYTPIAKCDIKSTLPKL